MCKAGVCGLIMLLVMPAAFSLADGNTVTWDTVWKHRMPDDYTALFVLLSPNARVLVYGIAREDVTNPRIGWVFLKNLQRVHEIELTSIMAWDLAEDGSVLAVAGTDGFVRLVSLDGPRDAAPVKLPIPPIRIDGGGEAVSSTCLRFVGPRDQRKLLVCSGGVYEPATLREFDVSKKGESVHVRQRPLEGLVMGIGGSWDAPIIANMFYIRKDDAKGRHLYGVEANMPSFVTRGGRGVYYSTTEPRWTPEDVCVGIWDVDTGKVLGKRYFPGKSVIGFPSIRANSASAYILRTSGDIIKWDFDQDRLVKWAGKRSIPSQRLNEQSFIVAERTAYVATTSGRTIVLMKSTLRSASDAK